MAILIRDAIIDHLYSKKLIRDAQHGFTQGRSCLTNLLKFLEEVTAYVDEGSPVDVLYLDFSKAFDKVNDGITSSLLKFADDTKLLRKVGTQDDCEALQKDLHTMHKWS